MQRIFQIAKYLHEGLYDITCEVEAGVDKCIQFIYLASVKTILNIDDQILKKASKLTGISEKSALVRQGLEALIALESAKRLAALGGSEKKLKSIPRRKSLTE